MNRAAAGQDASVRFTGCDPDPADSPRTWSIGLGLAMERVDLMNTNSAGFYRERGFRNADPQQLLVLKS